MAAVAELTALAPLSFAGLRLPLTIRLPEPMDDDDLMAFTRRNRPYQIERNARGELEIMSPLNSRGSHWEAYVIRALGNWAEANGGMYFSSNGGFTLPDSSMRSPDAAWIAQERWDALSGGDQRRYSPICPDFLIEILSESDSRPQTEAKMEMWIANGAQLAWLIDPFLQSVDVYRQGAATETLEAPAFVTAGSVVPGFRLDMTRFWTES